MWVSFLRLSWGKVVEKNLPWYLLRVLSHPPMGFFRITVHARPPVESFVECAQTVLHLNFKQVILMKFFFFLGAFAWSLA